MTSSNPEIINLGYEVLRANAGTLARVSWETCGEEFLSIATEMTALQELVILEELAVDVSMETLGIFADVGGWLTVFGLDCVWCRLCVTVVRARRC